MMRILLKCYEDETPYLLEATNVMMHDTLPDGSVLDVYRTALYITEANGVKEDGTFVILPICTAQVLVKRLLETGYLDLSEYMSTTFIKYDRRDKNQLQKVLENKSGGKCSE